MIDEYLTIFLTFPVWFFSVRLNNTVLEALGGALVQAEKLEIHYFPLRSTYYHFEYAFINYITCRKQYLSRNRKIFG